MAIYTTLKVYHDTYQLILDLFLFIKEFPREYKYSLGQDLKNISLELIKNIYLANKNYQKVAYLEKFYHIFMFLF